MGYIFFGLVVKGFREYPFTRIKNDGNKKTWSVKLLWIKIEVWIISSDDNEVTLILE